MYHQNKDLVDFYLVALYLVILFDTYIFELYIKFKRGVAILEEMGFIVNYEVKPNGAKFDSTTCVKSISHCIFNISPQKLNQILKIMGVL